MRETTRPGQHATFEGERCKIEVVAISRDLEKEENAVQVWVTVKGFITAPEQLRLTPREFEELVQDVAAANRRVQELAREFRRQLPDAMAWRPLGDDSDVIVIRTRREP